MESTTVNHTRPTRHPEGRSLAGLFSDLWRETSTLFRQEAELARAEISEKVSQVGSGVASLALGGAILFAGFLVLLAAAVMALAQVLPPDSAAWLSPLIIGAIVALIGIGLLLKARKDLKASNLKPSRTIRSVERDAHVVKEHVT